jgi:alkanesulfonate monooxygenase SsuD/methylene tetrahydromethanopterin reductase-like flavin-dependent oxidoreductase (luciferase family)
MKFMFHRLARLVYIGKTRDEAMQRARDGSIFLFSRFHAKFSKDIPTMIEPLIDAGVAFVGTVDDVRRQMAAVKEKLNPDWFMILSDQGFLPLEVMKEQVELFGTKIIPEFR